jgi:hypothetical protein
MGILELFGGEMCARIPRIETISRLVSMMHSGASVLAGSMKGPDETLGQLFDPC